MPRRTTILGLLLFTAGTIVGMAISFWYSTRHWDQWFSEYHMAPLMAEQTSTLKHLRSNDLQPLRTKIEDTVWRNLEVYATQKNLGRPWPISAKQEVQYHCSVLTTSAGNLEPRLFAQRSSVCKSLLGT